MNCDIKFSKEKDEVLQLTRGIGFNDVIDALEKKCLLAIMPHPNRKKYPKQKALFVEIKGYIYMVPFVEEKGKNQIFLKTIYPSRKYTKIYKEVSK